MKTKSERLIEAMKDYVERINRDSSLTSEMKEVLTRQFESNILSRQILETVKAEYGESDEN